MNLSYFALKSVLGRIERGRTGDYTGCTRPYLLSNDRGSRTSRQRPARYALTFTIPARPSRSLSQPLSRDAVGDGLGQVNAANRSRAVEIGKRARHLEHAMKGAR